MLVLSRKEAEQIVIGKDVVVTISRVCGNRVQLAIEAPEGVRILRGELVSSDNLAPAVPRSLGEDSCPKSPTKSLEEQGLL